MTTKIDPTTQTLAELGVTTPNQVLERFAEVRNHFDKQLTKEMDMVNWTMLRDAWLARKSGVLARITDNWLTAATFELKRFVGQGLNELRAHVEGRLKDLRLAAEASAEQAASERLDLSLPGVERPIGSRHLIRQT